MLVSVNEEVRCKRCISKDVYGQEVAIGWQKNLLTKLFNLYRVDSEL